MPKSESQIKKEIIAYLKERGIWHYVQHQSSPYQNVIKKGISDIIGIFQGRYLAIEIKDAKGLVRKEQKVFIEEVLEQGGVAFVARSVSEVKNKLHKFNLRPIEFYD